VNAWKHALKVGGLSLAILLVVLAVFSPRWWLMDEPRPGTFQWDRGLTYLAQVEAPFDQDIEPAMRWRPAPPLVAHTLGLSGPSAFVVPWLGVFGLTAYCLQLLWNRTGNGAYAVAATLTLATTSGWLAPLHWLGLNDAWVWLGLLVVAFSPSTWRIGLAVLLCTWCDERFIIGLPLAWTVRWGGKDPMNRRNLLTVAGALLPYVVVRLGFGGSPWAGETERHFIASHLLMSREWIGFAPLGWWMGLRAAWVPLVYELTQVTARARLGLLAVLAATAGVTVVLAADLSRSAAIVLPVAMAGLIRHGTQTPATVATRHARWLALIGLLLPAVHVVARKLDPVENIAIELLRWWALTR
jgi:hypothetical protein